MKEQFIYDNGNIVLKIEKEDACSYFTPEEVEKEHKIVKIIASKEFISLVEEMCFAFERRSCGCSIVLKTSNGDYVKYDISSDDVLQFSDNRFTIAVAVLCIEFGKFDNDRIDTLTKMVKSNTVINKTYTVRR